MKKITGKHYKSGQAVEVKVENGVIKEITDTETRHQPEFLPWLAPGLIDLQVNGFGGYDFNTLPLPDNIAEQVTSRLLENGVTSFCPTIVTNSDQAIENAMNRLARMRAANAMVEKEIIGIHLEGPFISPEDGPRGAHNKDYVKAPDWDLFERWQKAAQGLIKIVTISPEWPDNTEFIRRCVKSGVKVAIGHTAATAEQITAAVKAGATMSTHLGNGAHVMMPRHPNYIWEQLAQDDLWSGIIGDGFHLPMSVLKVFLKVKADHAFLVSDAAYLSGMAPGCYKTHIGGQVVLTSEGRLHLAENPNLLAGSAQLQTKGIANLVGNKIKSLAEAWELASVRPAAFLGLPAERGLVVGAPADLVTFTYETHIVVQQTYKAGVLVYDKANKGKEEKE